MNPYLLVIISGQPLLPLTHVYCTTFETSTCTCIRLALLYQWLCQSICHFATHNGVAFGYCYCSCTFELSLVVVGNVKECWVVCLERRVICDELIRFWGEILDICSKWDTHQMLVIAAMYLSIETDRYV